MRNFGHFDVVSRLARGFRLALVGGAVCLVPGPNALADADDIATSVVEGSAPESSVVVAKRKLDNETPKQGKAEESGLQPISTLADKEPHLADPEPTLAPVQTAAMQSSSKAPVKVASNTTEVESDSTSDARAPQPAVFHGIQPGVSTKKQLFDAWGDADEVSPTDTGQVHTFNLDSFRGVEVLVENGLVTLMKVNLHAPIGPVELASKVQADPSESVQVVDPETGRVAAYAYPERGIVMVVDQPDGIAPESTERVSQMLLQPLDAETFCLRAQGRPYGAFSLRIADLKQATAIAPREPHAHWLLSRALLDAGQAGAAKDAAKRAVDLDAENMAYRQRLGEALTAVGKYDDAVLATREVLDAKNVSILVRGEALHQMGLLASMGDASIAEKAVGFHTMAIAEADKLATSENVSDRRAAKRLLVESHLSIALEISRREYNNKMDNVAQWVSRASAFAEEMIENDGGDLGLRLRVAQQSLAALANFKPANDPEPLLQEINETLEEIKSNSSDPLWIDHLEWTTGIAYLNALQIEHHRRRPKQALEYSERAIELMADQADSRRDNPQTERLVGKLYFHIGAVHAVHQSEHAEAVEWYDRAFSLLLTETPECELVVPRHEGEALVSMAVSYWDQNDRNRAISLTKLGADLIEQAVTGNVIEKENLAVPYGNLAVMHKKLGNISESQRYAKLAESVNESEKATPAQAETKPAPKANQPGVATRRQPSATTQTARRPSASRSQSAAQSQTARQQQEATEAGPQRSRNTSPKRRVGRSRTYTR